MNPMDCKQAQNVWSRVMAAQTAAPCTNAEKTPAKTDCLAARMSGCARKTLLAISHDERCHAKKLGAIYFLLTGKKACPKKPENPCITCNAETLRRQYQRELSAREHYEALAPMSGARACTMRELALDECRHAQSIYELLQSCL